jgi:asparagine synthase (glutamine-hydrolysing)
MGVSIPMCGISGFINHTCSKDDWRSILTDSADALVHRGPDGSGIWFDEKTGCGLAHRRLAILDLSDNAGQPMVSSSGRFVLVYNGEIYNYQDLRSELEEQTDISWRSTSDTEVMLAAMESWGIEKAVRKFVGMFAFALWDKKDRLLHLGRDRLGIKPMYYSRCGSTFIFGSELKALRKHPAFRADIDRNAIALYLRHNCIPAPYTIYQNTYKLEPGKILMVRADDIQSGNELPAPQTYWSAQKVVETSQPISTGQTDAAYCIYELEQRLKSAVSMRMISDVPLGVFLSGGVDSSMVASLMQAQSSIPVKSFSIGFEEGAYDEARHARSVAEHLGTDHTELYVTPEEAMAAIPSLPVLYDEPFSDSSQIPTFLLSKLTRRFVTVSLSGDGGDELFGGYNRYRWVGRIRALQDRLPRAMIRKAADAACHISPAAWDSGFNRLAALLPMKYQFGAVGDKIHKLVNAMSFFSPEEIYYCLVSHWSKPEKIVRHAAEPGTKITDTKTHPRFDDFTELMMYLDMVTYLPDDILTKVDRASMGVGLEARVPLIDHRVVEFAWQIPMAMKIRNGTGKWILRKILDKYVPRELIERPKTGFAIPLDKWLRGPLRDWAAALLEPKKLTSEGFFDPGPIQLKWQQHLSGTHNWQYPLWDILMFQAWLDAN